MENKPGAAKSELKSKKGKKQGKKKEK